MLFYYLSLLYLRFLFDDELNCHFVKNKKKAGGLRGVEGTEHQLEGVFWRKNDLY
jgi:hypothetical protein